MYRYRWLPLLLAAIACPSLGAQLAILIHQPVEAGLAFEEVALEVQGYLNIDIRVDEKDLRGKDKLVGEVRNLGLVLKGVRTDALVYPPIDGMKPLVNIGISVVPGTRVLMGYDDKEKAFEGRMVVYVDAPRAAGTPKDRRMDRSSLPRQMGTLQMTLVMPEGLSALDTRGRKPLTARVALELHVSEFLDARIRLKAFRGRIIGSSKPESTAESVNTAANAIYNVICLQPISVTAPKDSHPGGYQEDAQGNPVRDAMKAQMPEIDKVWGISDQAFPGLRFNVRPWAFLQDQQLKVVTDEDVLVSKFPDSYPDCVEIYFIKQIVDRSWNGAAVIEGGMPQVRIIFSDEILDENVKGRLAHELGHVVRIPHVDIARFGDSYQGTPGTVVCVYPQWDRSHPLRNSADNMTHVWIPPELLVAQVVEPQATQQPPNCTGSVDCGTCASN